MKRIIMMLSIIATMGSYQAIRSELVPGAYTFKITKLGNICGQPELDEKIATAQKKGSVFHRLSEEMNQLVILVTKKIVSSK